MRFTRLLLALPILSYLLLLAAPARAQLDIDPTLERGLKPYGAFEGGAIDSVSMTNGNLNLHIPLLSYPQRGGKLHLGFFIKFDNNSYSYSIAGTGCSQKPYVCGWGTYINGALMEIVPDLNVNVFVSGVIPPSNGPYATIKTTDGSQHEMGATSSNWMTVDATGWLCLNSCATVIDRNGIRYSQFSTGAGPERIEDPNGNFITATANANGVLQTYVDTMGRTIPIPPTIPTTGDTSFSGCTGTLPTVAATLWTVPGYQGGTMNFTFCYATVYYGAETCTELSGVQTCGVTLIHNALLQSIVLPNNTTWTFQYDSANPNVSGSTATGNLLQVTLPTGGYIKYQWTPIYYCQTPSNTTATTYTYAVASRITNSNDGTGEHTWSYTFPSVGSANNSPYTTSSVDPLGQKTVHTMTTLSDTCSFYETQSQTYDPSGNLLKTVATAYNSVQDPLWNDTGGASHPASNVVPTSVTTTWPTGQVSQVQTAYDPGITMVAGHALYGLPTAKREYDYGSGAPGSLLRTTTTTYQALGNASYLANNLLTLPASVVVANGAGATVSATEYTYDQFSLASSGLTTAQQLDSTPPGGSSPGNPTTVVRGGNATTTTHFYNSGMPYQVTDPNLHTTTYAYSSTFLGAYPTTVTNPLNQVTSSNYDLNSGAVTSTTDPNGQVTSVTYDQMFRPIQISYPDSGATTYCYTDLGGPTCAEAPAPYEVVATTAITASIPKTETAKLDGFGRVIQTQLNSDQDGPDFTDTTYDPLGRVYTQSNPHRAASLTTDGITTFFYDALGRTCLVVPPDGTLPSGSTCPASSPSNDIFTTYSGNSTTVTDQAGVSRKSVTDGVGRLTQVFEDPAGLNYETDYTYDALNNLLTVNQKGGSSSSSNWRTRTFTYDSLSRLITAINPESGTISYSYDSNGNLLQKASPAPDQTGASTVTLSYCYDALNRVTGKAYTAQTCSNGLLPTPLVSYFYDQSGCLGATSCYNIGHRTGMTDQAGSEAWSYEKMGRVAVESRTTNALSKAATYAYNLDGSLASVAYPTAANGSTVETVAYQPGGAGRPLGLTSNSSGFVGDAHYTPSGAICYLQDYWDGTWTAVGTFNKRLQPATYQVVQQTSGTAPTVCTAMSTVAGIMDFSYNFVDANSHNNGNVQIISNNESWTRTQAFTYDSLNRITTAETYADNQPAFSGDTGSIKACWAETYTYDPWGNLTSLGPNSTTQPNYVGCTQESGFNYTAPGQITTKNQISAYCYDAAGNLVLETTCPTGTLTPAFQYDAENHLISTAGVNYTYDGDGKRVMKSNGTIYWHGTGSDAFMETDLSNNMKFMYFFFNGQRVARQNNSNQVTWYFGDHLGSSRVVWSVNGTDNSDFYPFGGERVFSTGAGNQYKFTGKERDLESGLDNFGARFNASTMGRFMTPDSTAYVQPINPQTWNLYAYALNRPLLYIDPTGHTVSLANCKDQSQCAAVLAKAGQLPDGVKVTVDKKGNLKLEGDLSKIKGGNALRLLQLVNSEKTVNFSIGDRAPLPGGGTQPIGGGASGTPSEGFARSFSVVQADPSKVDSGDLSGVFLGKDGSVSAGQIPGADEEEAAAHELLGHVWAEIAGGQPSIVGGQANPGNLKEALIAEDRVRNTDPSRGLKIRHQDSDQLIRPSDLPKITSPGSQP